MAKSDSDVQPSQRGQLDVKELEKVADLHEKVAGGRLIFSRVASFEESLPAMHIRNTCRQYMTRSQLVITETSQREWWSSLDHSKNRIYLLHDHNQPIGYGLIRRESVKSWISGGLLPEHRGRGLGRVLFASLCENLFKEGAKRVHLEVLESNERAHALYMKLGFVEEFCKDGVITMYRDRDDAQ